MVSNKSSGHVDQDGARRFYCVGPEASCPCDDCKCNKGFTLGSEIQPGLVSEEFRNRIKALGSYSCIESIPPVVLSHSTDPLFKVTLGLILTCGAMIGFMVGYLFFT